MAKQGLNISYIFLFDPTRLISDEIRGSFKNVLKYKLENFTDFNEIEQFIKKLPRGRKYTKICIYVMSGGVVGDSGKNDLAEFYSGVKQFDPEMNVICLINKQESEKKSDFPSTCITVQNNDNAILRITNHILGIISKENLERKYFSVKRSVQILLLFILLTIAIAIGSYFLFPQYFG